MTATNQFSADGPLPFSQLITDILDHHCEDRLTLGELSALLRDRAWGGLLLIFAAINILPLPPGATTITGIPLVLLSAQMAAGRSRPWFPKGLDGRGVTREELRKIVGKLLPWERRLESIFRPRMWALTNHRAARVIGLVCLLLSIILWLPIPFGNHAPAVAMTLFALALIYRDGLLAIVGGLATIVSIIIVSFSIGAVWLALNYALHHLLPGHF